MKRLIFALLFVGLIVGLASLIPNNPGTAYPVPSPLPPIPGASHPGLSVQPTCRKSSVEWKFRAPQFEVDRFEIQFCNPWGTGCWVALAPFFWGNQEIEYWTTSNLSTYLIGNSWDVQGIGYHPFEPSTPIYFTDIERIDCIDLIVKSRVRLPMIISKQWR